MAKNKISEFSSTAANNTDISNINIAEGCSPANVNNAIRSLMAQLKDQQDGTSGDPFTVSGALTASGTLVASGTLDVTGGFRLDGSAGTSGQVLLSAGSGNTPTWGAGFVTGMIMMWSGSIASIPSGWLLCNGSSGTPDLRNRFVIGAFQDNAGVANTTITGSNTQTGGSKDAIVVSHTHTATVTDPGHTHSIRNDNNNQNGSIPNGGNGDNPSTTTVGSATTGISVTNSTTGSSGTNANLVPYFALAYIMKV
jgi:microcystin-dependent protein